MEEGKYIVIEGHDGTGKSTQVSNIRTKLLEHGIKSIEFHEPEDETIPYTSAVRSLIKNGTLDRSPFSNLLLFSTSRHEIFHKSALPALKMGMFVVASRNYYSTEAYQGYGEGLDLDIINDITLKSTGQRYMDPDLALILDLNDEKERNRRINERGEIQNPDTFESKSDDFQTRVRLGYIAIAKRRNLPIISANQEPDVITEEIWQYIKPLINLK